MSSKLSVSQLPSFGIFILSNLNLMSELLLHHSASSLVKIWWETGYRQTGTYTERSVHDRHKSLASNLAVTDSCRDRSDMKLRPCLQSDKPIHDVFTNDSDNRSDSRSDNRYVYGGLYVSRLCGPLFLGTNSMVPNPLNVDNYRHKWICN